MLPTAFLLDRVAGDPEWFPHPVRGMGWAIARARGRCGGRGMGLFGSLLRGWRLRWEWWRVASS